MTTEISAMYGSEKVKGLPKTRNILTEHLRTVRSIGGQFTPPHQSVTAV